MTRATRTVLITGCSTGIGRATALRLAEAGHTVYATARRLESIADLADRGCRTLAIDVTDEESMHTAVDHVVDERGAVDVLVNNAGYSNSGAVETLRLDDLRTSSTPTSTDWSECASSCCPPCGRAGGEGSST